MPDDSTPKPCPPSVRPALLLALDALIFVALAFKAVELLLLGLDDVLAPWRAFGGMALCILAVPGWLAVVQRLGGIDSRERPWDQIAGLLFPVIALGALFSLPAVKGRSSAWLPLEWHKLPLNVEFMGSLSTSTALGMGVGFALFSVALVSRRRGVILALHGALIGWALLNTFSTARLPISHKSSTYLVCFVAPQVAALAFSVFGYRRWAARALLCAGMGSLLFWHYDGWLPLKAEPFQDRPVGFTKLYPTVDPSEFPLTYMRDFAISRDRRHLFTCYGPSSGIARIDLERSDAQIIGVPGLSRYLWPPIVDDVLLTMDWDKGDLFLFSGQPFERIDRKNILEEGRIAPWSFTVARDRLYVTFHEHPILAEYSWPDLDLLRTMNMKELGLTRFNAGLLEIIYDETEDALFAELGMIDVSDTFLLLKIDRETFQVVESAELPEGGLELISIPEKGTVLLASFFSDVVYELRASDLSPVREFAGPTNSRNLVYDASRDALIGLAFLPGELWAIDYETAEPFRRRDIGKKAQSLLLDVERDELYFGSDQGVYRVELTSWLGPPGEDPFRLEYATRNGKPVDP